MKESKLTYDPVVWVERGSGKGPPLQPAFFILAHDVRLTAADGGVYYLPSGTAFQVIGRTEFGPREATKELTR